MTYRASQNSLALRARDLQVPIPSSDSRLLHILRGYCEAIIGPRRGGELKVRQQVEAILSVSLSKGQPTIARVARELGVSSRTLWRRLADSGASFSDVLAELKQGCFLNIHKSSFNGR